MKPIPADYNAATPSGSLRLNFPDSREALRESGARPNHWTWLSDGEVMVGARIDDDPSDGLIGIPDWRTLVHLDDDGADDIDAIWMELLPILERSAFSIVEETRVFQLLAILEAVAPAEKLPFPNRLSLRKASALYRMGCPELAIAEIDAARRSGIELFPRFLPLYLGILQDVDPRRATREAEELASLSDPSAMLLAVCIEVWAAGLTSSDERSSEEVARRIVQLADRFDSASGRHDVRAVRLARVFFFRGLALLRLGKFEAAKQALELAYRIDPAEPVFDAARGLDSFGPVALAMAARLPADPLAA